MDGLIWRRDRIPSQVRERNLEFLNIHVMSPFLFPHACLFYYVSVVRMDHLACLGLRGTKFVSSSLDHQRRISRHEERVASISQPLSLSLSLSRTHICVVVVLGWDDSGFRYLGNFLPPPPGYILASFSFVGKFSFRV